MMISEIKTFNNLSLDSRDALKNIATIIECGHLLASSSDTEYSEIGDMVIYFASQYAEAAHKYALEKEQ